MYEFTKIDYSNLDIPEFYCYSRKPIFTMKSWLDFIVEDSNAEPAIFRVTQKGKFIGYIPLMYVKKFGVKIAGSPFRGWSTCWMGVEVEDKLKKMSIIQELMPYLYRYEGVHYCEITDRDITEEEILSNNIRYRSYETLELNIAKTDEELFKVFKVDCRNFIRQFERRGAILEEAEPNEEFAKEYYAELVDVFEKQGMAPTYSCEKVKRILKYNKEHVLCLRVKTPDGEPAATSIFFADKNRFYFWGGASFRKHQHYRPNEAMLWYAIGYFRDKGVKIFDMVGNRSYKRKFGAEVKVYYTMQFAKYRILFKLKNMAEIIYFRSLKRKI